MIILCSEAVAEYCSGLFNLHKNKLPLVRQLIKQLFPVIQFGQLLRKICPCLFRRKTVVGHMGYQKFQQFIHGVIYKVSIGVAPFAVFFVETVIRLAADESIIVQWHPAALAKQFARASQQCVDGNIEQHRDLL